MKTAQAIKRLRGRVMRARRPNRRVASDWSRREEMCKRVWLNYVETHGIPDDIPVRPDLVYADEGWRGWQDWLGVTDYKGNGGQQ